jgi:glycosyltransferase involved in cell wall biosynthesis
LAEESNIDLTVYFCSLQGLRTYEDEGFGIQLKWDIPLLDGYHHKFLRNLRSEVQVRGFFSLVNLELVVELYRNRFDALLVNGHMYFSYLLGVFAARLMGIPVLMRSETHMLLRRPDLKRALRRPLMSFFYRHLCDRCLTIGTRNHAFYKALGVDQASLFKVPYAVDNAFFVREMTAFRTRLREVRVEFGLPIDTPLILYASKLIPRKRPHDLLAAYRILRGRGVDVALLFVGSGELEESLRDYVGQHELADVHFAGFQNQSELPKFYAVADLFVLPSEDEPWGLVINEAMCAGLPVVASEEIGAVPDLVKDGYNGFRFPAGDVEALAAHLQTLVEDEGLRSRMGEKSLEIIGAWDLEQSVQGILAAMNSLSH